MAIENRNLEVGTRRVASYSKQDHGCTVERVELGATEWPGPSESLSRLRIRLRL